MNFLAVNLYVSRSQPHTIKIHKLKLTPKNPFVTTEIEEAIKEKRAALWKLRKNPSATNRNAFKKNKGTWCHTSFARVTTPLHQQATMNPYSTTTKNFQEHMKVVQGKVKLSTVSDLINPTDGTTVHCAPEKVELLNSFFSKQTELPGAKSFIPDVTSLTVNHHYTRYPATRVTSSKFFPL